MRRYRITPDGEKPVWASKRRLESLGDREGREAWYQQREPIRFGNPTYDNAAREAYEALALRLTKSDKPHQS